MKTYLLLALISLALLGCAKQKDPAPTVDLVGSWEIVSFVVDPPQANGVSDYLAYLRYLYAYNCSDIRIYYNFKSDNTFTETIQSICQSSGNTTDTVQEGSWSLNQTALSLTTDDGSGVNQTQTYNIAVSPATTSQNASLTFTFTNSGTTYTVKLIKP